MKTSRHFSLLIIFLTINLACIFSQDNSKFEIGLDLLNYNRNWVYYNGTLLNQTYGKQFVLEAIPAVYAKIPKDKYSLRFKIEYFQSTYLFNSVGGVMFRQVDGLFKEGRILSGIEKNIINKKIKVYYMIDFAISISNFKGLYTSGGDISPSYDIEHFNINSFGAALQPGLGMTFKITDYLILNLESSLFIGKGIDINDNHFINPESRLIPRPISLLGLSYVFKKMGQ
jgi:hypothetical protein